MNKKQQEKYSLIGKELGRQMAELKVAEEKLLQAWAEAFEAAVRNGNGISADTLSRKRFNTEYRTIEGKDVVIHLKKSNHDGAQT